MDQNFVGYFTTNKTFHTQPKGLTKPFITTNFSNSKLFSNKSNLFVITKMAASAFRSAVRSPSIRRAATKLADAAKTAPSPSPAASRSPLFSRVFRCPAEMSACSLQPFHTATASALMTSMLTVSRCGYGWLPEVTNDDN